MAPTYKLTYFDIRARGEVIRLVFAHAGVKYEDVRIQFADWPALKPKTPLGSLPVLEIDGKQYGQSMALATYLAREFGMYGKTNMDGLVIEAIQQTREDLLVAQAKVKFEKDEATKAELQKKLMETTIPTTFQFFCRILKENHSGYAVGDKISLGDLVIYEGTQVVLDNHPEVLDKYPEIKSLRTKLESGGNLKKYLAERKKHEF